MVTKKTDYRTLSDELDKILDKLQSGDISIDEAMPAYTRGMELVADLEKYLKDAENTIQELQAKRAE